MSAWSRAQPENEREERALFARRAQALPPASLPSLEAVLREVDRAREAQEARRAHGRAFVGMALAAACVAASIVSAPRIGGRLATQDRITADLDASTPNAALSFEPPTGPDETCEQAPDHASDHAIVAMSTEPPACYAPPVYFQLQTTKYETTNAPSCGANESCAVGGP